MAETFGSIFNNAKKAFSKESSDLLKYGFWFLALIPILSELVRAIFFKFSYLEEEALEAYLIANPEAAGGYLLFSVVFGIITAVLATAFSIYLAKSAINKKVSLKESWSYFWPYVAISLVLMIYVSGLLILLIIPGIIFVVYWSVAMYSFLDEKKGTKKIHDSLRNSYNLVKDNWWRTVGYGVLLSLIIAVIYLLLGFVFGILAFISSSIWMIAVSSMVSTLISVPITIFTVLFYGKYYLALKSGK